MRFIDYVKRNKDNVLWCNVSSNPNILMKDIFENPTLNWRHSEISRNPNVTIKDVLDNPQINWDFYNLSRCANISMEDVLDNPDLRWNFSELMYNKNITLKDFQNNKHLFHNYMNVTFDEYLENQNLNVTTRWSPDTNVKMVLFLGITSYLRTNLNVIYNINLKDILNNTNSNSFENEFFITTCCDISLKNILSHPEIKWDYQRMFLNTNISVFDVKECGIKYHKNEIMQQFLSLKIKGFYRNPANDIKLLKDKLVKNIYYSIFDTNPTTPIDFINGRYPNVEDNKFYYDNYFTSKPYRKKLIDQFIKCEKFVIMKVCHPTKDVFLNEFMNFS